MGSQTVILFEGEEGQSRRVLEGLKAKIRLESKLISIADVVVEAEKMARRYG